MDRIVACVTSVLQAAGACLGLSKETDTAGSDTAGRP